MRIGILGAGNVGGALGQAFVKVGHDVIFGVPDPTKEKYQYLVKEIGPKSCIVNVREAAEASDSVVVLATPWPATEDAIKEAGGLGGKIVVDCTNAIKSDYSGLIFPQDTSAAETIARWVPDARIVKAFNHIGYPVMANPRYANGAALALVASNDQEARTTVINLAREIGFQPQDAGELVGARLMEQLCLLWIYLALPIGLGPEFAFGLLQR